MSGFRIRRTAPLVAAFAAVALCLAAAQRAEAASQVIAPANARLELEASKGRLVRLDHPASSVFIADPKIADIQVKSPTLVYVIGKAAGETTLFAVGAHDEILLNTTIVVRHDLGRLQEALNQLVPDTAIDVSSVDNALVLNGTVFSAAEGEDVRRIAARFVPDPAQLVNKMQVDAPSQINLRVRVAEMSRETIKAFGFNWESALSPGNFLFGLATGNPVFAAGNIIPSPRAPLVQNPSAAVAGAKEFLTRQNGVNSAIAGFSAGRFDANALIDALDHEGIIHVLAEPNLTAVSGEVASFLAGGEFPIPVPQQNGTTTIEYKKFGVSLSFQATIGPRRRISMHVKPEVSELSTAGAIVIQSISVPSLTTRRAETTVELGSGQSFAIAGLLQNNVTHNFQKYPWLGDVPILGTLFRSDRFQRDESELVIIVTPYIVRPTSDKRMASPTDGYVAPNDAERVVGGAIYRPQVVNQSRSPLARSGTTLLGPFGFDLD
jgi:pilus assembly protein CpaC